MRKGYECSVCGSNTLIITGKIDGWDVSCGNGHTWTPWIGTVITIRHDKNPKDEAYECEECRRVLE